MAAEVLLKLARLTNNAAWREHAKAILAAAGTILQRYPTGAGRMLGALDFHLAPGREVVLVGEDRAALHATAAARYRPYDLLAGGPPAEVAALAPRVPLFAGRTALEGRPTAYVCAGQTCQLPVHTPEELAGLLEG